VYKGQDLESFSIESIHETQQNTSSDTVAQIVLEIYRVPRVMT